MIQNSHTSSRVIKVLLSGGALALLLFLSARLTASDPYLPFAIASAGAFWIRCGPTKKEWLTWLVALPIIVIVKQFPKAADLVLWIATLSAVAGLASLLSLLLRFIWSEAEHRRTVLAALLPAFLLPLYVVSAQNMLIIAQAVHATTLDLYLYKFDGSLGFQPSFWAGTLLLKHAVLYWISVLVYYSLPLAMGIAYAGSANLKRGRLSWYMLLLFVVAGLLGWVFYNLFPATGPRYVFGSGFPAMSLSLPYASLKRLALEPIAISQIFPRNAMPSLHFTWLILIWWNTRNFRWHVRALTALYLLFTALGTLGTGEHYLIDLIVAWPFALIVQGLLAPLPLRASARWITAAFGLMLTLSWNAALRYTNLFFGFRAFPWLAIAFTLLASEAVRRSLFKHVDRQSKGETETQSPRLDVAMVESVG